MAKPNLNTQLNFKSNIPILLNSLGKTTIWLLINSLIGISPLIFAVIISAIFPDLPYSIGRILSDGTILFFCATLTSAVMVDYLFIEMRFVKYIEFGLYLLPCVIVLIAGLIFGQLYFHPEAEAKTEIYIKLQNFIIFLTFIYCIGIKTILFINQHKK